MEGRAHAGIDVIILREPWLKVVSVRLNQSRIDTKTTKIR